MMMAVKMMVGNDAIGCDEYEDDIPFLSQTSIFQFCINLIVTSAIYINSNKRCKCAVGLELGQVGFQHVGRW